MWAGREALAFGRGGVAAAARATGLSRATVTKGMRAIQLGETIEPGRVRRPGGGRRPLEDHDVAARHRPGAARRRRGSRATATRSPGRRGASASLPARCATPATRSTTPRSRGTCAGWASACSPTARRRPGPERLDRGEQFRIVDRQVSSALARGDPAISVEVRHRKPSRASAPAGPRARAQPRPAPPRRVPGAGRGAAQARATTASSTSPPTTAGSASRSTRTTPASSWRRSAAGGSTWDASAARTRGRSRSPPNAAPTDSWPACGRPSCRGLPTRRAWPSASVISLPGRRAGTTSSTASSASGAGNGRASPVVSRRVVVSLIGNARLAHRRGVYARLDEASYARDGPASRTRCMARRRERPAAARGTTRSLPSDRRLRREAC